MKQLNQKYKKMRRSRDTANLIGFEPRSLFTAFYRGRHSQIRYSSRARVDPDPNLISLELEYLINSSKDKDPTKDSRIRISGNRTCIFEYKIPVFPSPQINKKMDDS